MEKTPAERRIEIRAAIDANIDRLGVVNGHRLDAEQKLARLNTQVKGRHMERKAYERLCVEQGKLKEQIARCQKELASLKGERRILNDRDLELTKDLTEMSDATLADQSPYVQRLVELRDKYMAFAKDPTRVASMRLMASEFATELAKIAQGFFSKRNDHGLAQSSDPDSSRGGTGSICRYCNRPRGEHAPDCQRRRGP